MSWVRCFGATLENPSPRELTFVSSVEWILWVLSDSCFECPLSKLVNFPAKPEKVRARHCQIYIGLHNGYNALSCDVPVLAHFIASIGLSHCCRIRGSLKTFKRFWCNIRYCKWASKKLYRLRWWHCLRCWLMPDVLFQLCTLKKDWRFLPHQQSDESEETDEIRKIKKVQSFFRGWLCRRRWKQIVEEYIKSPHAESMRIRNR